MKWRVMVELTGVDGAVRVHEVSAGGSAMTEYSPEAIGLTLAEGKRTLAGLQRHLVQAQTEDYRRGRRRCPRCGSQRPVKDLRMRRLLSLFGTLEVRCPRFAPCRCAVSRRHTLSPIAEIMPDRCTPEYERLVAKMGALLPYRRARMMLAEFLPLEDVPAVETTRQRTMHVGARLEREAVAAPSPPRPTERARSHSPSTPVTCDRFAATRYVPSKSSLPRSATTTDSRSCSAACPPRLIGNGSSCAACCTGWERRRPRRLPF